MDIKFNLKKKNLLLIVYTLCIFLYLGVFYYVFSFLQNQIYGVISPLEDNVELNQLMKKSFIINLDLDKFEEIVQNINNKTEPRELNNFKDIFK